MRVSVLGIGAMGLPIARNLLKAGHEVRVWNRSAGALVPLLAEGAQAAVSAQDAMQSPVCISLLADDAAFEAVFDAPTLASAVPGMVHLNMATISVAAAARAVATHRQAGLVYLGAPVFGRAEFAAAAKLQVVVGGPAAALAQVQPLLAAIGQKVWPVGENPVHAHLVKIAGNFMIGCAIETLGEAMALVEKNGLAPQVFTEIMTNTLFAAPAFQIYAGLLNAGRFEPAAFKLHLGLKDVNLALAAAQGAQAPLPLASLLRDQFTEAVASGHGQHDWAYLGEQIRRKAGLPAR
jgi:3-hydroxyisobutyrate dehydrogenase-like beta-hydroxyacid dehydrogenase